MRAKVRGPGASISYYFLLLLPPPQSLEFNVASPLSSYHPLPTSSSGRLGRPPLLRPHPPPASLCRLSLRPTLCACLCCRVPHPFTPLPALVLRPDTLRTLGGCPSLVPTPHLFPHLSPSPCDSPPPVIFWCLVFARVVFFACEGEGPGRLHSLAATLPKSLYTPSNWALRRRSGYTPTPPLPPMLS